MSEETLLVIGGPMDGSMHSRVLGLIGAPEFAPMPRNDEGHYVRRKYLMPDDATVLTCWVWSQGIRSLNDVSV